MRAESRLPGAKAVVKVVSPRILHKSDVGGVAIVDKSIEAVTSAIARMDAALTDEVRDPVGDHPGLAAPRPGEDEQRPREILHGLRLLGIEAQLRQQFGVYLYIQQAHLSGYTLNLKKQMSPSFITYSLPSERILPASLAPCSPPQAM